MTQKAFWICKAKNGTHTDELLQAGTDGFPRVWQNVKRIQVLEDGGEGSRTKENNDEKEHHGILNKFEMESFMTQRSLWNLEKILRERGAFREEGQHQKRVFRLCMKNIS